jgi:hypothetical protein
MTSLDASNKGFQMMAKLGYKPGSGLGKGASGRTEPIQLAMKEDKSGIGLENEKKRKFREEVEKSKKRAKAEEGRKLDYREQTRLEKAANRAEGQFKGAQRVIENIESKTAEDQEDAAKSDMNGKAEGPSPIDKLPLKSIDVVWRGLIRHRRQKEAESIMKRIVRDVYESDDEDVLGDFKPRRRKQQTYVEEDLDEEDEELDEFNALEPQERLRRVVEYLRNKYNYCFWCMCRYPDEQMEGCPGITEEDHE